MSPRLFITLASAVLVCTLSLAQGPAKDPVKGPPKDPVKVPVVDPVKDPVEDKTGKVKFIDMPPELRFADTSAVRLVLLHEQIEVQTRYGKLLVPLRDIRSIEFGLRIPPDAARRLETAAADLASEDFATREKASADLLALKELAWHAVQGLTKNPDKEVARRAIEIHEKLQNQLSEELRNLRPYDVVRTDAFTIHGNIVGAGLKARSPYFGDVEVQFANLRSYRRMRVGDLDREVIVDAGKYGLQQPRAWLDTGIELDGETPIHIQATGEIDLNPGAGNNAFKSGPGGNPQWANNRVEGHSPGVLVGRVGDKGTEFVIGDKYEGKPTERGKLYLRIGASPWANEAGQYTVKITAR